MKRKLMSYLLAVITLINTVTPALAATTYTDSTESVEYHKHTEDYTGTTVYAEIGSEFKVTIPKKVTLDGALKSGTYNVLVEGDIAGNEYVKVVPETYFLLYTKDKAPIPATVSQDRTGWSFLDFGTKANGLIETEGMTAGAWNGTFNFNIKLESSMELDSTINGGIINPDDGGEQVTLKVNNVSGVQKEQLLGALEESGQIENSDDIDAMINITTSNNTLDGIDDITINTTGVAKPGDTVVIVQEKEDEWDYITTETVTNNNEVRIPITSTKPVAFVQTQSNGTVHVHKYEEDIIEEATCSTDGTLSMMCECFKEYTFSIPASHELEQVEKKDENGELINKYYQCENCAYSILNLTQLFAGSQLEHDCQNYLISKYDSTNHWNVCTMCNTKFNITKHTHTTTWALGTETCETNNYYTNSCKCGYSYTGRKPCVWDGKVYTVSSGGYYHYRRCSVCSSAINKQYYIGSYGSGKLYTVSTADWEHPRNAAAENCYDKNGKEINCSNPGTCIVCNHTYSNNKHTLKVTNSTIHCEFCNQTFGTYKETITYNNSTPSTMTVQVTINLTNGATYYSEGSIRNVNNVFENIQNKNIKTNTTNTSVTMTKTGLFKSTTKSPYSCYTTIYVKINGISTVVQGPSFTAYPDKVVPTITSVTQTRNDNNSGWSTSSQMTITGTEGYSNTVTAKILDSNNKVYYTGTVAVQNGKYTITCAPDIEANESGKIFTVEITDGCSNKATKTFTVSKTDKKAPTINSPSESSKEWSQTKDMNFIAIDEGIGNVQIAFNNINEYVPMDKNGNTYTKGYQYSGDVYGSITAAIYYTDAIGNVTTQFIKVYNLDNTAPTISNVAVNGKQITVTANDLNKTLNMEGSGVSKYALTWTSAPPQDSDWQDSNILNVSGNGTYYIWVKDAVGNISECYKVRIIL